MDQPIPATALSDCSSESIAAELCSGNEKQHSRAIKCLEKNCKRLVIACLRKWKANGDDIEEIWLETLSIFWEQICRKHKQITTDNVCNYLIGIAYRVWLRTLPDMVEVPEPDVLIEVELGEETLSGKLGKWLGKSKKTRKVVLEPVYFEEDEKEDPWNRIPWDIVEACRQKLGKQVMRFLDAADQGYSNEELGHLFHLYKKNGEREVDLDTVKALKWKRSNLLTTCISEKKAARECFGSLDAGCRNLLRKYQDDVKWLHLAQKHGYSASKLQVFKQTDLFWKAFADDLQQTNDHEALKGKTENCLASLEICIKARLAKWKIDVIKYKEYKKNKNDDSGE